MSVRVQRWNDILAGVGLAFNVFGFVFGFDLEGRLPEKINIYSFSWYFLGLYALIMVLILAGTLSLILGIVGRKLCLLISGMILTAITMLSYLVFSRYLESIEVVLVPPVSEQTIRIGTNINRLTGRDGAIPVSPWRDGSPSNLTILVGQHACECSEEEGSEVSLVPIPVDKKKKVSVKPCCFIFQIIITGRRGTVEADDADIKPLGWTYMRLENFQNGFYRACVRESLPHIPLGAIVQLRGTSHERRLDQLGCVNRVIFELAS